MSTGKMRSIGFRCHTSNYVVDECRVRRGLPLALLHHHLPHRLTPERQPDLCDGWMGRENGHLRTMGMAGLS